MNQLAANHNTMVILVVLLLISVFASIGSLALLLVVLLG